MDNDTEQIERLVKAASDVLAKAGDDRDHTVGAAILSATGKIYPAVNLFHFTGGPCAETVALASAISDGNDTFTTVAVVGNNGRGVLSPCGRCRQILLDYSPNINVVTDKDGVLGSIPIGTLLPETYDWAAQNGGSDSA